MSHSSCPIHCISSHQILGCSELAVTKRLCDRHGVGVRVSEMVASCIFPRKVARTSR